MKKAQKNDDDLTTTNYAVLPAADSLQSNELPLGPAPLGHTAPKGVLRPSKIYTARTAYGQKLRVQISFPENGRTKQSFKAECDINNIMARYLKTGVLEHVRQNVGQYLDVTGADFQEAQNLVAGATSMFHELPSHIRTKFDNNPAEFLKFMENPRNAEEARELGLLAPEAKVATPLPGEPTKATGDALPPNVAPKSEPAAPAAPAPKAGA